MEINDWILAAAKRGLSPDQFAVELAAELNGPRHFVDYLSFSVPTMHPEIRVDSVVWSTHTGALLRSRRHDLKNSAMYLNSPVARIYREGTGFKRKLAAQVADDDYPILRELVAEGYTDYFIELLQLTPTLQSFVSWSTKKDGGFSEQDYGELASLTHHLEVAIGMMAKQKALEGLLSAYLGSQAARLVLSGQYKRGDGNSIEAVIWLSDLRGFTTFTDQHSVEETLKRLNYSFDVIGQSISDHNGEILKFIGDAVLAVFPVTSARTDKEAARSAFLAAQDATSKLYQSRDAFSEPIRIGVGLHRGVVTFGNVGTSNRLDFTVIGAPVNEAARVEALCKALNEDVLLTDAVAALLPEYGLRCLGFHNLKGVTRQRELFGIPKA